MEPTRAGVRSALEEQNRDLCQTGLELGSRYGRTQIEHDAIWYQAQEIPQRLVSEFTYGPKEGMEFEAVDYLLGAVKRVRRASEDEVRTMLPHDHPGCGL